MVKPAFFLGCHVQSQIISPRHCCQHAIEGVYLSIPYRIDSGESDQKDEFEGAITKSCSTDPQFPNQAAKNGT